MNTFLVLMLLAFNIVTIDRPHEMPRPFLEPVETIHDAFRRCGMAGDSVSAMEVMDSTGVVTPLSASIVLETAVLDVVDVSDVDNWFDTFPDATLLTGVGLIVYSEDSIDNRDSFMLFTTEEANSPRWWFVIFRENIFLTPPETLQTWIVQEDNFCGLYEISIEASNESSQRG